MMIRFSYPQGISIHTLAASARESIEYRKEIVKNTMQTNTPWTPRVVFCFFTLFDK